MTVSMLRCSLHARVSCADAGAIDSLEIDCITLHAEQRELLLEAPRGSTPAAINAPRIMSPLAPAKQSK